ncbi:MAG: LysM peptidoglycan-binding domain-containing protein [Methylacidiphilales bacterium]|nr:LysM peptidoglycan-binding domain-containing protein [Candidatus Methylacidiphilales bacterium]
MENNDSPLKPQPTGGLKLMTVFIAVLALHVLVIGGFTVYHLMSGSGSDADLLADKTHKAGAGTDVQAPDTSDKSATASTAPIDASSTAANPSATASTSPVSAASATTTAPATAAPAPAVQSNPLQSELVTSPPDIAPVPATSAEIASGPVKMPAPQSQPTTEIESPLAAAPAPATTPENEATIAYTVKAHDSLAKIARHHHVTVAQLKSANNLTTDFLKINQKLVIPTAIPAAAMVTTSAEASGPIMASNDATMTTATPAPAEPKIHKGAKAKALASTEAPSGMHHHLYTVVKGDTLTRIAHKFKTTPNAIMTANNITDPAKLSIGKKLKIPSAESRSAKNTPAPASPPAAVQSGTPTAQLANFVE